MTLSREKEIWATALWVEKHHGSDGPHYIADQIGRLALEGDSEGKAFWLHVARRYEALMSGSAPGCGAQ